MPDLAAFQEWVTKEERLTFGPGSVLLEGDPGYDDPAEETEATKALDGLLQDGLGQQDDSEQKP